MKTYLFAFLIGFNYLVFAQELSEPFKMPTNGQVATCILLLHQAGEINYPKVFKGDFCFSISETKLIDSLAIPKGIPKLNYYVNSYSLLKIDLESDVDTIQSRMRKFMNRQSKDFVLGTYGLNKNNANCLKIIFSPVFANRVITAHLSLPKEGGFEFDECYILFVLDYKGDVLSFMAHDKFGNRAW